jgi:PEP-CTERM motif
MSPRHRHPVFCLLTLSSALVLCLPAHAGTITALGRSVFPGTSTGQIGPIGSSPAPNNNGSSAPSSNLINYQVFASNSGRLDVEFVVADSGGVTEYRFAQVLFNITGQPWSGFDFELGYGVGSDFVRSAADDGLGFDLDSPAPPAGSPAFATAAQGLDTLSFGGGQVAGPTPLPMGFTIDVPDALASWNPAGQARFTLRQLPVITAVPEPSTAMLLLAGSLALIACRRRAATP